MKKIIFLFILLISSRNVNSQNLVPNGSFETPSVTYSTIGFNLILNNCFTTAGATPPDSWRVNIADPDRMKEGTIYCLYDNDLAQDGDYYAVLNNTEDIEVTLISPLVQGCLYQFSCFLNLETMGGTITQASRVMFFFYAPDGATIQSPIISWNLWSYFATPFTAAANSTILEIRNFVNASGVGIDNIQVTLLGCPPLPVTWLYVRSKGNAIEWATASETNSDRFEVISSEGILITTVKASGNTSQNSYYKVNVGNGYYVIKQIDIDGRYSYTKMIRVTGKDETHHIPFFYNINWLGQELPSR